jgi:ubiquinone/menaquinone biosynthesis C-methylase UbiE
MFSDPIKNLKMFGLREDDVVADLGAGTGFYSVAAGHIASRGKVYAVEIAKDFLAVIHKKIKDAKLHNVEVLWGDVEKIRGSGIADGILDAVIASNILLQVEHKDNFISEIKRILKPKGRVLLIDWLASSTIVSPRIVVSKNKAREMFEKHGFVLDREITPGDHHYGMILIKQ